jgi:hypothetical protein
MNIAFGLSCIAFGIIAIYQTVIYPDYTKGLNQTFDLLKYSTTTLITVLVLIALYKVNSTTCESTLLMSNLREMYILATAFVLY